MTSPVHNTHLIVFAKAPMPGRVKTRLAAAIGDVAAARLAERMLNETLACAARASPRSIELCCAPDADHPALAQAAARVGARLTTQVGADLGARMAHAFAAALARDGRVIVIGTDCPGLTTDVLDNAARALAAGYDAVFVPALDGGYVLIGLTRNDPELFRDIPWSTERVMAETERRLAQLNWRWTTLAPLADIDLPQDLKLIPKEWYA